MLKYRKIRWAASLRWGLVEESGSHHTHWCERQNPATISPYQNTYVKYDWSRKLFSVWGCQLQSPPKSNNLFPILVLAVNCSNFSKKQQPERPSTVYERNHKCDACVLDWTLCTGFGDPGRHFQSSSRTNCDFIPVVTGKEMQHFTDFI